MNLIAHLVIVFRHWRTTNYYSNIVSMKASLNQGPWAELELWEKDSSYEERSLYVLTGPIYDETSPCSAFQKSEVCLPNADEAHMIPSAYWTVSYTHLTLPTICSV